MVARSQEDSFLRWHTFTLKLSCRTLDAGFLPEYLGVSLFVGAELPIGGMLRVAAPYPHYITKNSAYAALSFGKTTIINRKGATPQTWNPCDSLILAHKGISVKPVENSPKKNGKKSQKMFRKTIALFGNIGYT